MIKNKNEYIELAKATEECSPIFQIQKTIEISRKVIKSKKEFVLNSEKIYNAKEEIMLEMISKQTPPIIDQKSDN